MADVAVEVKNNGIADRMKRTEVTEQDPVERAKNFKEVCLGYDNEVAVKEASRCLHCKNPKCVRRVSCINKYTRIYQPY